MFLQCTILHLVTRVEIFTSLLVHTHEAQIAMVRARGSYEAQELPRASQPHQVSRTIRMRQPYYLLLVPGRPGLCWAAAMRQPYYLLLGPGRPELYWAVAMRQPYNLLLGPGRPGLCWAAATRQRR